MCLWFTAGMTKDDNFLAELSKSNMAAFNSFALLEIIIATAKRSLSQCHHRSSLRSQGVSHFGSLAVAASHRDGLTRQVETPGYGLMVLLLA
jgi:hypothetical protein